MSSAQDERDAVREDCSEEQLERICQYLDGVLSEDELTVMEKHISECSECREQYRRECLIREVLKRSCCEKAPQQLRTAIQMRLTQVTVFRND